MAMAIHAHVDGRCIAANPAFARLFGYQIDELLGLRVDELGLLDSATLARLSNIVAEKGQLADSYISVRARDGSIREVLASIQMASWGDEQFIITLLQDLTEFSHARQALADAETRFRLIFEAIPLPVVVYDRATLAILDVNARTVEQYGFSRAELLERSVLDLWLPEERTAQITTLRAETIAPAGQARHLTRGGTTLDIEMTSQPLSYGGRRVCLSIFADVTEQRANEEARRRSEEQLRIIAEVTNDVLWELDPIAGTLTYSSGLRTMFGYDVAPQTTPDWWLQRVHPDDRERVVRELDATLKGTTGLWTSQYRFRRTDGSYAHVLDRGYMMWNAHADVHVVGAMVDISRQIELQEATARAKLDERRRLARDLHDAVTQSLYSLSLMSAAAHRRALLGEEGATFDYVDRLGQLARQTLKEMRLLVYELRPAALQDEPLLVALQTRLDAVEQRSGIAARLRVECEHDLPAGVQSQLFGVVETALNNALKHASATAVDIIIGGDAQRLVLSIIDNGVGFTPTAGDILAGQGLVSMRKRVDNLGGSFEIDSEHGHGTTVRVILELGKLHNG